MLNSFSAISQDVQFSQYYNLIQFQNPAFVGTSIAWRATLHSRVQWPGIDAKYVTGVAAVDYNLSKYNSGVGVMFVSDDQESAIRSYKAMAQYAYQANLSSKTILRAGINTGLVNKTLNNAALYYPEQFNGSGFNNQNNTSVTSKNYLDITTGLLLYTDYFWLGVSAAHINNPNQSLTGGIDRIPVKFDFLTGIKINLLSKQTMRYLTENDEDVWSIYPTLLYKYQGKSDQLDIGLHTIYDIFKIGLWYRGLPVKNYDQRTNNESVIALAGIKIRNVSVSYSYDFGISNLAPYSRGAHELNLTILHQNKKKAEQKYKSLPCPEFYGF